MPWSRSPRQDAVIVMPTALPPTAAGLTLLAVIIAHAKSDELASRVLPGKKRRSAWLAAADHTSHRVGCELT